MFRSCLILIFLFYSGVLFAQTDSLPAQKNWYDHNARLYNPQPCGGCPQNKLEKFMQNPYKYKSNTPIVLPDSLIDRLRFIMPIVPLKEEIEKPVAILQHYFTILL